MEVQSSNLAAELEDTIPEPPLQYAIAEVSMAPHTLHTRTQEQVGKTSNPERSLACRDQVKKSSNRERALACDIGMVSVSIDSDEQQQQNIHNAQTSPITPDNPVSALLDLFEISLETSTISTRPT